MEDAKHSVSISAKLYKEMKTYCQMNGLKLNVFAEELLRSAFNVERYGEAPFTKFTEPVEVVKEQEKETTIVTPTIDVYPELLETEKKIKERDNVSVDVVETPPVNEHEEPVVHKRTRKVTRLN